MGWKSWKSKKGKKRALRTLRSLRPLSPLSSPNHSQMTQKTQPPQFNWDHWEIVCCQSPQNRHSPHKICGGCVCLVILSITYFLAFFAACLFIKS